MTCSIRFSLVTLRHLACLLILLSCGYKTSAQNSDVIYATKVVSVDERNCSLGACSASYENSGSLATDSKIDYITLYPSANGNPARVRLQLSSIVPAGSRAGFVISNNQGLIDLSVLNGFVIKTYDQGEDG